MENPKPKFKNVDPTTNEVFLCWIVDCVKELAKDPQFLADYEEWQRQRAAQGARPI